MDSFKILTQGIKFDSKKFLNDFNKFNNTKVMYFYYLYFFVFYFSFIFFLEKSPFSR